METIIMLGIIIIAIIGGKFGVEWGKFKINFEADNFIEKVIKYQNNRQKRSMKQKLLDIHAKTLEIKTPNDLMKILQINSKENKDKS